MQHGIQNIIESHAIGISLTGILIVFTALLVISLFIAALPKALAILDPYLPEAAHAHHSASEPDPDEAEVVAVIGFALHHHHHKS